MHRYFGQISGRNTRQTCVSVLGHADYRANYACPGHEPSGGRHRDGRPTLVTAQPRLLSATEAALRLRIARRTLHRWVRDGRIPALYVPTGMLRFRESDVERMLSAERSAR